MKNQKILMVVSAAFLFACGPANCPEPVSPAGEKASSEPSSQTTALVRGEIEASLTSWNDGPIKQRIVDFVLGTVTEGSETFVPEEARIAVFDNDGTLWSEMPVYFQLFFVMDRVRGLAPEHPEWKETEPFKAVLEGDMKGVLASGHEGLFALLDATDAGMTTDEFEKEVDRWIRDARHPEKMVPYTDLVYQPMLELMTLLHDRDFKVFIVSGGGIDFMRVWAPRVYGIPEERIIGSIGNARFELREGRAVILKEPGTAFIDDKAGKPLGIHWSIGKRPILAFGNSDGDLEMLQYTAGGRGNAFMGIVHHTDADREYAYDRESTIGHLDKALDEGTSKGWAVVDMKNDWKVVYPGDGN